MQCALILPAAGQSSRMRGTDKLLQDVDGMPCLRTMALRGVNAGLAVVVTLPSDDHPRARALADSPVRRITVANAQDGMAQSLRQAVAALPEETDAAIVLPPDMPAIESDDLRALVEASRNQPDAAIVQACTQDQTPGHPILFRRSLFGTFNALTGDTGARDIVMANTASRLLLPLTGDRARQDLDTPEEWATWRAGPAAPK